MFLSATIIMVLLTPKRRETFNQEDNRLFKLLELRKHPLYLNGSYASAFFSLFSGDVDLYQLVPEAELKHVLTSEIPSILLRANKLPTAGVTEIKVGDVKYSLRQFFRVRVATLMRNVVKSDSKRVKIDIWAYRNGFIEEVTIIYDFAPSMKIPTKDFQDAIREDVVKYMHTKPNMYKALKRMRILYESEGMGKKVAHVDALIKDAYAGTLYVALSRLEAMLTAKDIPTRLKRMAFDHLKNLVRKLGLMTETMVERFRTPTKANMKSVHKALLTRLNSTLQHPVERILLQS